jgi:hypothetical protein
MRRYFDAFLYYANFGSRQLMFRVPLDAVDVTTARQYCRARFASVTTTDKHLIVSLRSDHDPDDEWLDPPGLLADMVQVRAGLAAGDLRLLYLGWLLGIAEDYEVDGEEVEPPAGAW